MSRVDYADLMFCISVVILIVTSLGIGILYYVCRIAQNPISQPVMSLFVRIERRSDDNPRLYFNKWLATRWRLMHYLVVQGSRAQQPSSHSSD